MSKESSASGRVLGWRMFLFSPKHPGTLFECTLEAKLLRIRYPQRAAICPIVLTFLGLFQVLWTT